MKKVFIVLAAMALLIIQAGQSYLIVLYKTDRPWPAYDQEAGLIGDADSSAGRITWLDLGEAPERTTYVTVSRSIMFDGEPIGRITVNVNNAPLLEARRIFLVRTGLITGAEVIIIFGLMRLRGSQIAGPRSGQGLYS
ncbi:MAG: hypothetical protein WD492_10415 [Alkalispirochaeta sp.]